MRIPVYLRARSSRFECDEMGYLSARHWLVVVLVVVLLFGRCRISQTMGDLGKGIWNFRNAISEQANGTDFSSPDAVRQLNQLQPYQLQPSCNSDVDNQ